MSPHKGENLAGPVVSDLGEVMRTSGHIRGQTTGVGQDVETSTLTRLPFGPDTR